MDFTTSIASEDIQREALVILYENLNNKIVELQPTWTSKDDQLWAALGRGNPDWTVELIPPENFHPGTLEGVMDRPIEQFPNVCTIAYEANPQNSNDDQGEFYRERLMIEVMVKSEESEEEVNSRIQKTLEAIHRVFMDSRDNRTLNNLVPEVGSMPRQTIGNVFGRRLERGRGARWYWQGGSLEYVIDKFITF